MAYLSKVFNYVSFFRHSGHQIGRKIGDMLEVLTFAAIARDEQLLKRLQLEPKLYGFSEAGHKVEFAFNREIQNSIVGGDITDPKDIIGFIECKKVGVEQTVNANFKKKFSKYDNRSMKIPFGETFIVGFSPRNYAPTKYAVSAKKSEITVAINDKIILKEPLNGSTEHKRIVFTLDQNGVSTLIRDNSSLRGIKEHLQNCRILEVFGHNDDGIIAVLNDCLPGPQTPEKAKQSSFVALDVRKKRFGSFDKRPAEKECVSILVLTEFSHWEKKSRNMITACIDINLTVDDDIIIEAFEAFEEQFKSDYYNLITKDAYLNNKDIKSLADAVVEKYKGKIFTDISDNSLKEILYKNGTLAVV